MSELMSYLPLYWHENLEMQEIQKLDTDLSKLREDSNIITTEAYINTADNERLQEWERDLGLTNEGTFEERRNNILSFFKGKGKLNEASIKAIVENFAHGARCVVRFDDSTIKLYIIPKVESDVSFPRIESLLMKKKPAHIGLYIERFYSTWDNVKNDFKTWNNVKAKGTWNDISLHLGEV